MFSLYPKVKHKSNRGRYLQIMSAKDPYDQTVVVSNDDTFHVRFPNNFVDFPLGEVRVGNKLWTKLI